VNGRILVSCCAAIVAVPLAGQQTPRRTPDIYFAPTPQVLADAMLTLAKVTPDDVVYDLGSGDGRIIVLAAQKYHARGVGIELQPHLVDISRQVAREGEVEDRAGLNEPSGFIGFGGPRVHQFVPGKWCSRADIFDCVGKSVQRPRYVVELE
jgi:hypothetical protein